MTQRGLYSPEAVGGRASTATAAPRPTSPIRERRNGFTVALEGGRRFIVRCRPPYFILEASPGCQERFGLCEPEQLTTAILDHIVTGWRLPSGRPLPSESVLSHWVRDQITSLLATRLRTQLERLVGRADPTIVAVQRALRRVSSQLPGVAMCPTLYRSRHLVSDILRFRAAAIVAANLDDIVLPAQQAQILRSQEVARLKTLAASQGADVSITVSTAGVRSGGARRTEPSLCQAVRHLWNWRALLSPTGRSYRSLNRTLANLPRGVSGRLVCELRRVTLPRPITDRLEFRLVTVYLASRRYLRHDGPEVRKVLLNARGPQIAAAISRVATYTRNDLRITRQGDIRFFVQFLLDYPGPYGRTIQALAKKSIRWHQRELARERARVLDEYGAKTRLGVPDGPPPQAPSVRRLETVEDVVREGQRMEHCVASYVPQAVQGRCYLFHVEHNGESATVMVSRDGEIRQSWGPRNRRNGASQWGERVLRDWARGLRPAAFPEAG